MSSFNQNSSYNLKITQLATQMSVLVAKELSLNDNKSAQVSKTIAFALFNFFQPQSIGTEEQLSQSSDRSSPDCKAIQANKVQKKNKVKEPRTAYIFFCIEKRPEVTAKYPGESSRFITNQLASLWKDLTEENQEKYKKMQEDDKARYLREKSEQKETTPNDEQKGQTKNDASCDVYLKIGAASKLKVAELRAYAEQHLAFFQKHKKPTFNLTALLYAVKNTMKKTELVDMVTNKTEKKGKKVQSTSHKPTTATLIFTYLLAKNPDLLKIRQECTLAIGEIFKKQIDFDYFFEEINDYVSQQGFELNFDDDEVEIFHAYVNDLSKGELRSRAEGTDELSHERSKSQDPLAPASLKSIDELSLDRSKGTDEVGVQPTQISKQSINEDRLSLVNSANLNLGYCNPIAMSFLHTKTKKDIITFVLKWRNYFYTEQSLKKMKKPELLDIANDIFNDLDVNMF